MIRKDEPSGARGEVVRLVRPNILIVDYNQEASAHLAQLLRRDFSEVVVVTPQEALEVALEKEFAVVLAIQRGPGIGGMKLLARVRRRWGRSRGLLVAGYADAESLAEAISSREGSEYLFMPWDEQELVRVLRDTGRQYLVRRAQRSAREHAINALRSSERLYRTMVELAPEAMLLFDRAGHCLEANSLACDLLGYARDDLPRLTAADLHLSTDGASSEPTHSVRSVRRQDGLELRLEVSVRGLPDGGACVIVREASAPAAAPETQPVASRREPGPGTPGP
ncbi:MAG: PAS domain S-box protein [Chloroflexi bacterium]|nr:PAS domain S-box protein [Chloroflexota bacterium]